MGGVNERQKMPYNILLVDDDKDFREEFRSYLEDYKVVEAASGQEALNVLRKPNEIDLVILDVMMPGLDGIEVLKQIKALVPRLGIIILTGYSSKDVAIEALKARADDYIEKPLSIKNIKYSIENLLDAKAAQDNAGLTGTKGRIERVKNFVQRNYNKKVTLRDAAKAVYLSPKYLSRVFGQNAGIGFNEYRLKVKINKAKGLLKDTGYTISQISSELGYENIESFARVFKELVGRTPTEYRRKDGIKAKSRILGRPNGKRNRKKNR